MAVARDHFPLMTADEFQTWNDGTDARYELVDGLVRMMAPPRDQHGQIVLNIGAALRGTVKPPCRAVAEAGIRLDERNYFQADIAVRCGTSDPAGRPTPPAIVIEVLSPSTRRFDLSQKLLRYAELPSVQEIWLVDSSRAWVQVWQRDGARWTVAVTTGDASFRSAFLDADIALDEVYAGVVFAPEAEDDADAVGL